RGRGRIGEDSRTDVGRVCTTSRSRRIPVIQPYTSAPAQMPVIPHCTQSYHQLGRTQLCPAVLFVMSSNCQESEEVLLQRRDAARRRCYVCTASIVHHCVHSA